MRYLNTVILLILLINTLVYGTFHPVVGHKPCFEYTREQCCGNTDSRPDYASPCIIPLEPTFKSGWQCEPELYAIREDPDNIGVCDNCFMTKDVDYFGNDIFGEDGQQYIVDAGSEKDCQQACDNEPKCRFWTFLDNRCYFKHSKFGYKNKPGAISGSKCISTEKKLAKDLKEKGKDLGFLKVHLAHKLKKQIESERKNLKTLEARHNEALDLLNVNLANKEEEIESERKKLETLEARHNEEIQEKDNKIDDQEKHFVSLNTKIQNFVFDHENFEKELEKKMRKLNP